MPEPQTPNNPPATPNEPSQAASSTPPTPEPWRAGDEALPQFRGKTAEEILGIAQNMYGVLERFNQPVPQAAPPPPTSVADDDFITGAQLKAYLQQTAQTQVTPAIEKTYEAIASQSLAVARQQYADDFRRWGPEINGYLAQLPAAQKTLDNIERVVKLVRGDHVDELARERAAQYAAETPTMRPNGTAGTGTVPTNNTLTLESEDLPPNWREQAKAMGLTESTLMEFCRSNNQTVPEFFASMKKLKDRGWDSQGVTPIIGEGGRLKGYSVQGGAR